MIFHRANNASYNREQCRSSLPNPETMPRPNGVGDFGRWLEEGTVLEGENRDPFSWSDVSAVRGGWKVEKQEEETKPEHKRVERETRREKTREREREREREKREGGHLAIKNTY